MLVLTFQRKQRALGDIHFCFLSQLAYNSEILSKFVRNITTIRLRSQFVILKMDINMTDKIGKRRAANCVYHIGASIKDLGKKWFGFSKMATK